MKLTLARIAELHCPAGKKDRLVFDDEQRGLAVRVTAGGSKSYLAQYSFAGSKRRVPLGSVDAISLKAAREATRALMGEVAQSRDPAAERKEVARKARLQAAETALTLDKLLDDWRTLRLADRRAGYAKEAVRALRKAFPKFLGLPAVDLTRAAVVRTLDSMTKADAAAMASRTAAYGRACYSWALKRGTVAANPFEKLPLTTTAKRDRVLADAELVAVWRATEGCGSYQDIVRALILTGQRREEVAAMTWGELAEDLSAWTIPASRTKNRVAHIVPLSKAARELIASRPRLGDYVFPGLRGAFSGWSKAKVALDAKAGVKDWRLHDLRRTMATGMQRLGVRLEVTEQALNHVSGSRAGIVGIYQRHDFANEKRVALEAWGEHVAALVEGRTECANVIGLASRRGSSSGQRHV